MTDEGLIITKVLNFLSIKKLKTYHIKVIKMVLLFGYKKQSNIDSANKFRLCDNTILEKVKPEVDLEIHEAKNKKGYIMTSHEMRRNVFVLF